MRPTEKEIADWLLATMNLFEVELPTQHKVVGLFLEGLKQEWKKLDGGTDAS